MQVDSNFLQLRHRIVTWIADLHEKFEFSPETLFLSVAVFDRFLVSVKVGSLVFDGCCVLFYDLSEFVSAFSVVLMVLPPPYIFKNQWCDLFPHLKFNVTSAIVACGVSLSNAAHASQSPQSNTPYYPDHRSQGRLTESVGTTHTSIC